MKKTILFAFALIPLLASCNQNSRGFPNPFPEDQYVPTGFNIALEERSQGSLSSQETALVNSTYTKLEEHNKKITRVEGSYHERNYERAFAGEFEQGYSVSNKMFDDEFSIIRVDNTEENPDPEFVMRQETNSKTTTVVDYSYGRSTVQSTTQSFHYLGKKVAESKPAYVESETIGDASYVLEQTLEIYGEDQTSIGFSILQEKEEDTNPIVPDEKHFVIPMTGYIFPTTEASTIPGITKEGEAVLIKETHTPYGEKGIYSLPDGREYEAMVNSIIVSRLIKAPVGSDEEDWYLVNHVRKYSETAITSDVIQPNVPISYLSNPIVISFIEEKYRFSIADQKSTAVIPPVEIVS